MSALIAELAKDLFFGSLCLPLSAAACSPIKRKSFDYETVVHLHEVFAQAINTLCAPIVRWMMLIGVKLSCKKVFSSWLHLD